jgi:hypothetical protein
VEGKSPILEKINASKSLNALTHLIHQFVLVILLVNVKKSCFALKEKMSHYKGGGAQWEK